MERFLMADGCAVRIFDSGIGSCGEDAPVLLLLHGYFESIEVWDMLIPYLLPHFRVVAMDIPGHGVSQVMGEIHTMEFVADTARAVMKSLEIDNFSVIGHSMGGYVTLAMVSKYPQLLNHAVMLHSTPNPDSEQKKVLRQREIELVLAGKKDMLAKTTPFKGFSMANRKVFTLAIEELEDQIYLTDDAGVLALLRGMSERKDMNQMLKATTVPCMFVFGMDDEYIPIEVAKTVEQNHPEAKTVWMEKSGHMSLIEQVADLAEVLIAELK